MQSSLPECVLCSQVSAEEGTLCWLVRLASHAMPPRAANTSKYFISPVHVFVKFNNVNYVQAGGPDQAEAGML